MIRLCYDMAQKRNFNDKIKRELFFRWIDYDLILYLKIFHQFNEEDHLKIIEEIIKISEFLKDIHYSYIEILPYHKMGEYKYEALGINCFEYAIPGKENIEKFKIQNQ